MLMTGSTRFSFWRRSWQPALALLGASLISNAASANESVEAFYSNTPVSLIVSTAAGGGVDAYSRLLARHLGRHIPGNPKIVSMTIVPLRRNARR